MNEASGGRLGRFGRFGRLAGRVARSRTAFVVWVVVVTLVVVALAFRASAQVGPGRIQARVQPALDGRTELAVPPLGAVRADTHVAPVQLRLELRELDLLRAIEPDGSTTGLDGDAVEAVTEQVQADLGAAIARLVVLLALGSGAAGAVAAMAFPGRRSLARLGAGALLGPLVVGALVAPAAIGFDSDRFVRAPEFEGPLRSAPELVQRVGSLETRFGSVESRTRVLAERITSLYSSVVTSDIERSEGEVVLLHVSDLHLNAVGLSIAQELARNFQVDAVVDTGDITSFGFEPEAGFIDLLEGFEVPYYLVAGNHDSEAVRLRFASSDAVHYLDGEVVDIAGVRVLGVPDPTETALRKIPREELDRRYRAQQPLIRRLLRAEEPDLLLVHNPVQAQAAVGRVGAVAAGHTHRTRLEITGGTAIAVVGSSGAAGLENLLVDEGQPYRFQLLRFVDGELVAVDHIELRGAGGDFALQRRLVSMDEETGEDVLTEQVEEPSADELDEEELDRVTTTMSTTTTSPSGSGSGSGSGTSSDSGSADSPTSTSTTTGTVEEPGG